MKYMELREEAEKLLLWAHEQNPGQWIDHCRNVARAAETIAKQSGLDTDRAYVSGLLHDIGYYSYRDGKGTISHIYTGYKLLIEKGSEDIAEALNCDYDGIFTMRDNRKAEQKKRKTAALVGAENLYNQFI